MEKIVLIGYKCSGKSTIGKELAEELDYQFIDTDEYADGMLKIAYGVDMGIGDYIRKFGIEKYREIEKTIIEKIVDFNGNYVISAGGGLPLSIDMDWLNEKSNTIYLDVSNEELAKRIIKADNKDRPSFDGLKDSEILSKIIDEMHVRRDIYNKCKIKCCNDDIKVELVKLLIK